MLELKIFKSEFKLPMLFIDEVVDASVEVVLVVLIVTEEDSIGALEVVAVQAVLVVGGVLIVVVDVTGVDVVLDKGNVEGTT